MKAHRALRPISDELSAAQLDALWDESTNWQQNSDSKSVRNALSGNDRNTAGSYLYWLHSHLKDGQPISEEVRLFTIGALDAFFSGMGRITLGTAFGMEQPSRGKPRVRAGAIDAINGLIEFLNSEKKFSLGIPGDGPSAFDVASQLLARHWKYKRSAETLRKHWQDRKRESKTE